MNTQFKKFINTYIWVVIILFSVRCLFSGKTLINNFSSYDIFSYAGESIGISAIIMLLYERFIWKLLPHNDIPILHNCYIGSITSSYDNKKYPAKLEIKQTLLTLKITFISGESKSKSICYSIDDSSGYTKLTYTYLSEPSALVRNRSSIHYGTAMIYLDNPSELRGQYFTDRKTTGDLLLYVDADA